MRIFYWRDTLEGSFIHEDLKNNAPKWERLFWTDTSELSGLLHKVTVPRRFREGKTQKQ